MGHRANGIPMVGVLCIVNPIGKKDWKREDDMANEVDVTKVATIDAKHLDDEFQKFPGMFAFWAVGEAEAKTKALFAKTTMEQAYASIASQQRASADFYKKKVTEAQIQEMVEGNPDYVKAREAFNKATGEALRTSAVVSALEKKGDMLRQLGFTRSAELAHLKDSA